jgi:Tol biopolymer transport system component
LYEASVDHPEERILIVGTQAKGAYVPPLLGRPGRLLWIREKTLVAQSFSADRLRLSGSPLSVADDIAASSIGDSAFWVSETGILVYRSGNAEKTRMGWIGRNGATISLIGKEGVYGVPRISPDGGRVALRGRTDSGNTDIWVYEFKSDTLTRLTFDPRIDTFPAWSPDGQEVAFSCGGQLCRSNTNGARPADHLTTQGLNGKRLLDWSRDGQYLLYAEADLHTRGDLWVLPLQSGRVAAPFLQTPFNELYGQFSPDSKWIAYSSDESGRQEIYVRYFFAPGGKRQISNNGGTQPRWRRDGKELFYLAGGNMMAASIRMHAGTIESDPPHVLFPISTIGGTFYSYDVSADGNRFLVLQPVGGSGAGALTILSGW